MKTVHVAAGIIRKDGSDELLAVQRGYGNMQGLWEFPGGKLMRGESPEDAVRRELMEELQVKVTNLRDFYTVEYDYPDFHLSMECYYCSLADESDEPQKHDRQLDIRWIPRTSLATVEWMPADKGLIDALIELKEDRLEANGAANDAEAATTDEPATKPKRAPKRRSKKRPKPGLLDGIDTSDLSADERELVRRRAAIKKSMKGNKRANTKPELLVRQRLRAAGLTGYRLEWKVPGKPDIAFPGARSPSSSTAAFGTAAPSATRASPSATLSFGRQSSVATSSATALPSTHLPKWAGRASPSGNVSSKRTASTPPWKRSSSRCAPQSRSARSEPSTRPTQASHIHVTNLRKPLSSKPFKSVTRYL